MNKLKNLKPQTAFLIIGLIYGISFLFVTPPFQVPDEDVHFFKAIYLSEGHFIPGKFENGSGVYIPLNAKITVDSLSPNFLIYSNKEKISNLNSLWTLQTNSVLTFVDLSKVAVITYSPVPYLTPALCMFLGNLLNLSPLILMYIGRLANLLTWLFLTYLAIKTIPIHKWVLLMIALMPMTLYEAASLSADSFTIGLSFLVIAILFKFAFDDKEAITTKNILILFVLTLLLSLSKQGYFLLLFLFLMIPVAKFGSKNKKILIFISLFLSILLISGYWDLIVKDFLILPTTFSVNGQVNYVLANPLIFVNTIAHTWNTYILLYSVSLVGDFGVLYIPFPIELVWLYILLLYITSILDKKDVIVSLNQKLIAIITLSTIFIFIFLAIYSTWNAVGNDIIDGIQGRYFIPFLPILFLLFYYNKEIQLFGRNTSLIMTNLNLIVLTSVIFFLSFGLFMIVTY